MSEYFESKVAGKSPVTIDNPQTFKKSVPAIVIGTASSKERSSESIESRSALIYDVDESDESYDHVIKRLFEEQPKESAYFERIIFPTLRSTVEAPRYRLIIPLSREVNKQEYGILMMRVAEMLEITYDPSSETWSQLQLLPIVTKNNVDQPLKTMHKGIPLIVERLLKEENKQESAQTLKVVSETFIDTTEISREEAVSLVNSYCLAEKDRLNDYQGFLPAYLTIKKAYDEELITSEIAKELVAILALGNEEWALANQLKLVKDKAVVKGQFDFRAFFGRVQTAESISWQSELEYNQRGKLERTLSNAVLILLNDPNFTNTFCFNEFASRIEVVTSDGERKSITDSDLSSIRLFLDKHWNLTMPKSDVADCVTNISRLKSYHPVRDYLNGLVWDGKHRVETYWIDRLGVQDTPYAREITKKFLVGAVARAFEAGVKFEILPVLIGNQGCGKSVSISNLVPDENFFTDDLRELGTKENALQLQGKWIIELAELSAVKKTDSNTLKQFVSTRSDEFRAPYAQFSEAHPRQCVMVGTTNQSSFLSDHTGNRRLFPLRCNAQPVRIKPFCEPREVLDQVIAEAVALYRSREIELFPSQEALEVLAGLTEDYQVYDPAHEDILEYLEMLVPSNWSEASEEVKRLYFEYRNDPKTQARIVGDVLDFESDCLESIIETSIKEIRKVVFDLSTGSSAGRLDTLGTKIKSTLSFQGFKQVRSGNKRVFRKDE